MTDAELRALLEEKSPSELTPEECAALRNAVRESPDMLREVADRIQIEQHLAMALGRPQVTVERVLARLADRRARTLGVWTRYGLVVCGVVAAVLAGLIAIRGGRDGRPARELAGRSEEAPADGAAGEQSPALIDESETVPSKPPKTSPSDKPPNGATAGTTAPAPPTSAAGTEETNGSLREAGFFESSPDDDRTPDEKSLGRWFAAVGSLPLKLSAQPIGADRFGRLDGLARLRRPLPETATLRMSSADFTGVRIHVWSGRRGVMFDASATPLRWTAYATERSGTSVLPTGYVTIGRDDGRMIRTNPVGVSRIDLRHADGTVSLARGDVLLVEAPLDGLTTDVHFEGSVSFRDLALVTTPALPPPRPTAERPTSDLLANAKGMWVRGGDESAVLDGQDDGGVKLSAKANKKACWAMLPLPNVAGLREIVVRLDGVTPGTGLAFGDGKAMPLSAMMFLASKAVPGAVRCSRMPPTTATIEAVEPIDAGSSLFVKDTVWFRIRQCGGVQWVDVSRDGTRWVTQADAHPAFSSIGIFAAPHPSARSIRLSTLQQGLFPRIESLCPADLRAAAVELPSQGPFAAWLAAADAAKPPTAEAGAWRLACGLKAVAENATKDLAIDLLGLLWRESLGMAMPRAARQDLLDDILSVAPVVDEPAGAGRIASLFDALGMKLAADGEPRCYSAIAHEQANVPLRCGQPFLAFSQPLARRELVGLLGIGDWKSVEAVSERLKFYGFSAPPRNEPFFKWAAALAASRLASKPTLMPLDWRHPLLVSPNKESMSVQAELTAAIAGEDWQDACRLIDAAAADGQVDLLQDRDDSGLFMSLPVVVATAMRDDPRLLEVMRKERERIGGLRVLEASAAGNVAGVETATVQFHGTAAAAKAHVWLADRNMAAGRFAAARRHYEAAAASLEGVDGDRADEHEKQRKRTAAAIDLTRRLGVQATPTQPTIPLLTAGTSAINATKQSRLEGDVGGNPAAVPLPLSQGGVDWPPNAVDWAARQIAVLPLEDRLLVSNRFQVASHDPTTGVLQWRAGLGPDAAGAHESSGQAMRPCADNARIYVRRLRKAGPSVVALNRVDGAVVWDVPATPDRQFISDPLPVDGGILAICMVRRLEESSTLALAWLDAATGRLVREATVCNFAAGWWGIRTCQLSEFGGQFILVAGGSVIACDGDGRVRWVRRDTWLPPPVDGFWMLVAQEPPLLVDGRLHVVQPAVPGIVSLDPSSGRIAWRLADASISRLRGAARGRLVVERIGAVATAGGSTGPAMELVGIDAATAAMAWKFGPADLLDATLTTDDQVLVAIREPASGKNVRVASIVRLDPRTGEEQGRWPVGGCEDPMPCLGPFVPSAVGLRAFFGRGAVDPSRDLMLLAPAP